jgi:hypothetical protein
VKRFLLGLLLGSVAPVAAEPARVAVVCQEVILPMIVNCSRTATFNKGYTPAVCNRS